MNAEVFELYETTINSILTLTLTFESIRKQNKSKTDYVSVVPSRSNTTAPSTVSLCHSLSSKPGTTFLGTTCVLLLDRYGQYHKAKAPVDSGSQVTPLTRSLGRRLHLPVKNIGVLLRKSEVLLLRFLEV